MNWSWLFTAFFAFLLLISLAGVAYLFNTNNSLQGQLSDAAALQNSTQSQLAASQASASRIHSQYLASQEALSQSQSELAATEAQVTALQAQLVEKEAALAESRADIDEQKKRAQALVLELDSLETSVNSSMAWFRDNAVFPKGYSWQSGIFIDRMLSDCVDKGELNLACISYLMENTAFAIHYRSDIEKGRLDYLQGVRETIDLGWGDCEDYSLLFKSILNYASQADPSLAMVAWQPGGSGDFRVYPKESTPEKETGSYWYVPNAKKAQMGSLNGSSRYAVCFRSSAYSGHCAVAVSQNKVGSSSSIASLSGARVFEPQTGQFLGTVGIEFPLCAMPSCRKDVREVSLIIADSDLYSFESKGWTGYEDSLAKIRETKKGFLPG
jgi:predicted transglutaminase-like cysteine proteinase